MFICFHKLIYAKFNNIFVAFIKKYLKIIILQTT
jgi:hypothetical protein